MISSVVPYWDRKSGLLLTLPPPPHLCACPGGLRDPTRATTTTTTVRGQLRSGGPSQMLCPGRGSCNVCLVFAKCAWPDGDSLGKGRAIDHRRCPLSGAVARALRVPREQGTTPRRHRADVSRRGTGQRRRYRRCRLVLFRGLRLLRLLRLELPGIGDPGVDGIKLPTYDLAFWEVFVQVAEDFGETPPLRQAEDDFLRWFPWALGAN